MYRNEREKYECILGGFKWVLSTEYVSVLYEVQYTRIYSYVYCTTVLSTSVAPEPNLAPWQNLFGSVAFYIM